MRRTKTRRAAALLAFLLALAVLTPTLTLPVEAVKQSDIDALKEDANDLASQRKKLQERINALKSDKSKAIQQKELLDEQVDNTQAEINNVQRQIDTYTALIAQTEDELAEANWYPRSEVPADTAHMSLTAEMIEQFRLGRV